MRTARTGYCGKLGSELRSFKIPCSERRGTRAWIVVPRLGCESTKKTATNEFQSLLHAVETKPSALPCRFEVKAHAGITDREMNRIQRFLQLHTELPHAAMLHCIVQGFL